MKTPKRRSARNVQVYRDPISGRVGLYMVSHWVRHSVTLPEGYRLALEDGERLIYDFKKELVYGHRLDILINQCLSEKEKRTALDSL